jgi:hypothetical protein
MAIATPARDPGTTTAQPPSVAAPPRQAPRASGLVARLGGAGQALRWAILAVMLLLVGLRDDPSLDTFRTRAAAAPHVFRLLDWQVERASAAAGSILRALQGDLPEPAAADLASLRAYFGASASARAAGRIEAEATIRHLVTQGWRGEELVLPSPLASDRPIVFPPVQFTLTEPPRVLIVSPRDRIEVSQYVLLDPGLDQAAVERLEAGVAERGLSTLVTSIGGLSTYPAMVLDQGSARAVLSAVAHEWVHAYFFFQPLGRGYWANQEVRTINETAAELAGDELGRRLAQQLDLPAQPAATDNSRQAEFNRLLRETRLEVDRLLALGQVEAAERYMEERRLLLESRGFTIRRLNQAYFAFHGSYAEGPAGSSPLAGQVRQLRQQSASLGDFLRTIAQVRSPADLAHLLTQPGGYSPTP